MKRILFLAVLMVLFGFGKVNAQTPIKVQAIPASGVWYNCCAGNEVTTDPGSTHDLCCVIAGGKATWSQAVPPGTYTLTIRVASLQSTGSFHFDFGGGEITVPNTGGWQNWQTITAPKTVTVATALTTETMTVDTIPYNINWWQLTPTTPVPPVTNAAASFACTPSFAPVILSTFVPAGAAGLTFSIQNPSSTPLTITGANVPAPFALSGPSGNGLPVTIAPGAAQMLTIKFIPTAVGMFNATVVFNANVQGGTFSMGVMGVAK